MIPSVTGINPTSTASTRCPAIMLANRRIISAKGLMIAPISSSTSSIAHIRMSVMAVRATDQVARDLENSADMDREQRAQREGAGGVDVAGRGPAEFREPAAAEQPEQVTQRKETEQVAEQDEEKERPEKRDEA